MGRKRKRLRHAEERCLVRGSEGWKRARVDSRIRQKQPENSGEAVADFLHSVSLLLRQPSGYLLLPPQFPAGQQGNELLSGMQYITSDTDAGSFVGCQLLMLPFKINY